MAKQSRYSCQAIIFMYNYIQGLDRHIATKQTVKDFFDDEDEGRDHERSKSQLGLVLESSRFYLTSIQHKKLCGTETAYNCATSDPNKCIYSRTGLWCDKLLVHGCTQCRQAEWGRRRRSNDTPLLPCLLCLH